MHLDQHVEPEIASGGGEVARHAIVERRHDQQDAIGADRAAFDDLIGSRMKSLRSTGRAQAARAARRSSSLPWKYGASVNTDRHVAPPA